MSSQASESAEFRQPASQHAAGRVGRSALFVYAAAIVYASLNPFFGWRAAESFSLFSWPRYFSLFDVVINVLAYVPIGGLLVNVQLRGRKPTEQEWPLVPFALAVFGGLLLSLTLESLQTLLPLRVASPVDLLANTGGALLGASLLLMPWGRGKLASLFRWRYRHFAAGEATSWGLLLLGAWFVAQLNPVIPIFEAGHIASPFDTVTAQSPYEPLILLPQAVGITLNVCGFALFVSLLIRPGKRATASVMAVLVLGFMLKISAASLMMKAPQLADWMGPATVIGLTSGLILFAYFSRINFRWRAFCATLFIFAGGLMAKLTSIYGAFDDSLRLLNWPYGHLATFAGLTRWLHETWPLLAIMFAAWLFVRRPAQH